MAISNGGDFGSSQPILSSYFKINFTLNFEFRTFKMSPTPNNAFTGSRLLQAALSIKYLYLVSNKTVQKLVWYDHHEPKLYFEPE